MEATQLANSIRLNVWALRQLNSLNCCYVLLIQHEMMKLVLFRQHANRDVPWVSTIQHYLYMHYYTCTQFTFYILYYVHWQRVIRTVYYNTLPTTQTQTWVPCKSVFSNIMAQVSVWQASETECHIELNLRLYIDVVHALLFM